MAISLKVVSENPDGSANAVCNYDEVGEQLLVQEGITAIIKQYIAQQKGKEQMNTVWEVASEIESLAYRVSNVKDMVEMIATDVQDPHSGALWGVRDHLETLAEKIETQVQNLMDIHRDQMVKEVEITSEVKPPKKAKKK